MTCQSLLLGSLKMLSFPSASIPYVPCIFMCIYCIDCVYSLLWGVSDLEGLGIS